MEYIFVGWNEAEGDCVYSTNLVDCVFEMYLTFDFGDRYSPTEFVDALLDKNDVRFGVSIKKNILHAPDEMRSDINDALLAEGLIKGRENFIL